MYRDTNFLHINDLVVFSPVVQSHTVITMVRTPKM